MMKRFFIVGPGGREGYGRHDGQHIRTQKHINTHTPYTLVNEKKQNKTTTGYGKKRGCGNTEKGIRFWKSPGPIENTLRCVFAYTRTVPNDYGSTDLHEQPTGSEWNFLLRGQRHSPVGRFLSYSSSSLTFFHSSVLLHFSSSFFFIPSLLDGTHEQEPSP